MNVQAIIMSGVASDEITTMNSTLGIETIKKVREFYQENDTSHSPGDKVVQILTSQTTNDEVFVEHECISEGLIRITRMTRFDKGKIPDYLLDIYTAYSNNEKPNEKKDENHDS